MPEAIAAPPVPVVNAPPAAATPPSPNAAKDAAFAKLEAINDHAGTEPQPEPRRSEIKPGPGKPKEPEKAAQPPKEVAPANVPDDEIPEAAAAPAEKPGEKPAEKPPEAAKPADAKPAEGNKPKSGWQMYRDLEKTHKALEAERDTLKKEIESIRSNPDAVKTHPEFKAITERAEAAVKRAQELEDHIRFVDYTKSQEYQEQYQKPYEQAAELATKRATQLKVANEDGSTRPLTTDEFWKIVAIGDEDDAISAAEKLFGPGSSKAAAVIERRNEIIKAHQAMEGAKQKYQKEGAERFRLAQEQYKKQQGELQQQTMARATKFKELVTSGEKNEKMKDVFTAAEGDQEGAEMLAKYRHEADRAFSGGAQIAPTDEPWTADQLLAKHAVMRNRAGAFPYAVRQLRAANAKIAALEAKLKEFNKSEPGEGDTATGGAPPVVGSALDQALAKLDRLQ